MHDCLQNSGGSSHASRRINAIHAAAVKNIRPRGVAAIADTYGVGGVGPAQEEVPQNAHGVIRRARERQGHSYMMRKNFL